MWRVFIAWADARLRRRVAELEAQLDATTAERDALAAVCARDRARIEAETAAFGRRRAEDEHAGKLS